MEVIAISSLIDKYYTPGLAKKVMEGESIMDTGENMKSLIQNRPELTFLFASQKTNATVKEEDSILISKSATCSVDVALIVNGEKISEVKFFNDVMLVGYATSEQRINFRSAKETTLTTEAVVV